MTLAAAAPGYIAVVEAFGLLQERNEGEMHPCLMGHAELIEHLRDERHGVGVKHHLLVPVLRSTLLVEETLPAFAENLPQVERVRTDARNLPIESAQENHESVLEGTLLDMELEVPFVERVEKEAEHHREALVFRTSGTRQHGVLSRIGVWGYVRTHHIIN